MDRPAPRIHRPRRVGLLRIALLIACPLLVALNFLHHRSTELGDPLGVHVDTGLVLAAIALKWFVLVGSVMVLRSWLEAIQGRPKQAAFEVLAMGLPLVLLTLVLAVTRVHWAYRLSNESEKYHSFVSAGDTFAVQDANYSRVSWLWQHGVTQIAESLLVFLVISALAMLGVFLGRRAWWFPVVVLPGILGVYSLLFGLFVIDFDVFHGDIWSGAVLLDLLCPPYVEPYSLIASLYYATFAASLAWVTICRGRLRSAQIEGAPGAIDS